MNQPRVISHERATTIAAAKIAGVDPTTLIAMSEQRILPGPIRDYTTRDFAIDGMEEGADWRFYLVCDIRRVEQAYRPTPRAREARALMLDALAHVIAAFEKHRQASVLLSDLERAA